MVSRAPSLPPAPLLAWPRSGFIRSRRIDYHAGETWWPNNSAASTNVATTPTLIAEGGRALHRMQGAYPINLSKRTSLVSLSRKTRKRSSGVFVVWVLHRNAIRSLLTRPHTLIHHPPTRCARSDNLNRSRRVILGPPRAIHALCWIWSSENTSSRHLGG